MNEKNQEGDKEIPEPTAAADQGAPPTNSALVRVDLGAVSHKGLVRPNNEDHYIVLRYGRTMEKLLTNLPDQVPNRSEEVGYGMLVADGMGGAVAGEVASRLAILTLLDLVIRTPDWIFGTGLRLTEEVERRLAERYRQVDAALRQEAAIHPGLSGMGTTMTVARSVSNQLVIGHIGDSRAYLFRQGTLHQLTKDHTLVQSLVEEGEMTREEAAEHPLRHALSRSIGAHAAPSDGDFQHIQIADNDQLLLCTDGLTDMVDSGMIASVLASATTAKKACDALVQQALKKGGRDNVTVVLARYRNPQTAGTTPSRSDDVARLTRLPSLRSWWSSILGKLSR
jgi:protein phosphatase